MMRRKEALVSILLVLVVTATLRGSDWPQLLGPTSDAVYAGPALSLEWPTEGPPRIWTRDLGEGYSNPVVGEGRLVVCHRLEDDLVVEGLDPKTGTNYWSFKHPMKFRDGAFFDSGPRPTPSIHGGKVFIHNTDGYLTCLDLKDGHSLWSLNAKARFRSGATWHGCVSSPLVTDKAVILQVGGSNAAVVAFAPRTGQVLWQALDEKASASSPVLATLEGKGVVLVATRSALHALDPDTGANLWEYATRKQSSGDVYAANPIIAANHVFLSGWYNLGALLLQVEAGQPKKIWHLDNAISTHYAAGIIYEGYIYGFHGHAWERGGPILRCVELATGKLMWEQPQTGSGTICRFADHLLILTENGELKLVQASPKQFKLKAQCQVVGRTTRNYPALADGFAYVRGPKQLVCLDLRAKK